MIQFFKKLWKDFTWTEIDEWREQELRFIEENKQQAVDNIIEKGWKILSVDSRLMHYSYKIAKDSTIAEITIREALNL